MQLNDDDAWVFRQLGAHPALREKSRIGVAVSGGSDSTALLNLLAKNAQEQSVTLAAATVDHGLREESAAEAAFVSSLCAKLDIPHEILKWEGWDGTGNLQAEARKARYHLLATWGQRQGVQTIALGHTMDDQAETFLMRLGREAGIDGLSAMQHEFERDGMTFCRPVLAVTRDALRAYLTRQDVPWCDDPSNDDETFDRVKARKALRALAPLGIDSGSLSAVAQNMAQARDALRQYTHETAQQIVRFDKGDLLIDAQGLSAVPAEISRRILIAALNWIAPTFYPPRRDTLIELETSINQRRGFTVQGCFVTSDKQSIRVTREFNAVKDLRGNPDEIWDRRWSLSGPKDEGVSIAALGESGMRALVDRTNSELPRSSLLSSPAVWRADTLIAAPIAGFASGWTVELLRKDADFYASILSH